MHNHNLVLSINTDGDSYQERLQIASTLALDGDEKAAATAMSTLIRRMINNDLRKFPIEDRTKALIDAAAQEALANIVEHASEAQEVTYGGVGQKSYNVGIKEEAPTAIPTRQIEVDVLAVLRKSTVRDGKVYLSSDRLERKLYDKVNQVLVAMGGKWVAGKTQAHVFSEADPEEFALCFTELQASGVYTDPKDLGFFRTSPELADRLVAMANLQPGERVMEPNVGDGRIALPAAAIVGLENVHCIEIFAPNVKRAQSAGLTVLHQDFLSVKPPENEADRFDVVLMNPPFSKNQDVAHVTHACQFLKKTGRLLAITSPSWQMQSKNSKAEAFQELLEVSQADVIDIAAGAFKAAGTMVATRIVTLHAENLPWHQVEVEVEDLCELEAPAA